MTDTTRPACDGILKAAGFKSEPVCEGESVSCDFTHPFYIIPDGAMEGFSALEFAAMKAAMGRRRRMARIYDDRLFGASKRNAHIALGGRFPVSFERYLDRRAEVLGDIDPGEPTEYVLVFT